MSDFKHELRRYIDGLEEPVSVHETMNRGSAPRPSRIPVAILAGAAVVLVPALVLIGLRLLPSQQESVTGTTAPAISETTTTEPG